MINSVLSKEDALIVPSLAATPDRHVYRADIDGLRAVAVGLVVASHAGLGLSGGYVGVDVFFVISGFLITSLIQKDLQRGDFSLTGFWERRVRRIMPALLVMLIGTLAVGWFVLTPKAYVSLAKSVIGVCCLASNVQFSRNSNYFDPSGTTRPLLHTWSLGVEEQFYIVWPVALYVLSRKLPPKWSRAAVTAICGASLVACVGLVASFPIATFYLPHTRAWELLVGALLALHRKNLTSAHGLRHRRVWTETAAVTGLMLIVVPAFMYDDRTPFPGAAAVPPVVGTALLIGLGGFQPMATAVHRMLSSSGVVFIGLCSYSIYLWHWPVLAFVAADRLVAPTLPRRVAWAAVGVALGVISWRFVEGPTRSRRILATRTAIFQATFAALLALGLVALVIWRERGFDRRLPARAQLLAATGQFDEMQFVANHEPSDIPERLTRIGSRLAEPRILVWGDSHAMMYLKGLDALCRERNAAAWAATHSSTPPVAGYTRRSIHGLNERAVPFAESLMEFIVERRIRSVVLAGYWSEYADDPRFLDALIETIRRIRSKGVKVYVMKDVPTYDFDIGAQLVRDAWLERDANRWCVTTRQYNEDNAFYRSWEPRLAAEHVFILDVLSYFPALPTTPDAYLSWDEGGAWYRDGNHLSSHGSMNVRLIFGTVLESISREVEPE